jgi:hypothetical protein
MMDKNSGLGNYKKRPRIAHSGPDLKQRFRVTHPFHPLSNREFELLQYRRVWGRDHVVFVDDQGRTIALPVAWTDVLGVCDPFVAASAGRSYFRVEDLARLVELIKGLRS